MGVSRVYLLLAPTIDVSIVLFFFSFLAVKSVRKTGSKNPVLIQGIGWGGDISGFLTHTPTDSAKQMIAGVHIYVSSVVTSYTKL